VVVATTTAEGMHSLHVWQLQYELPEYDEDGRQIESETCKVKQHRKVVSAHPNSITSICAVPEHTSYWTDAAFVTCSKGSGTLNENHQGTIRLWTVDGDALPMKLQNGEFVEKLHCEASVLKVIVTTNYAGHTVIAACSTDFTGFELWNITTGTYERWDYAGMLVIS
jgi:WD40 repeat protein